MITLFKLALDPNRYKRVKRIPRDKIETLWREDFYDGVLSGVVRYQGRRYYAECLGDQTQHTPTRRYFLMELTRAQERSLVTRVNAFIKHVADTRYTAFGQRFPPAVRPKSEWDKFYSNPRFKHELRRTGRVVGWFSGWLSQDFEKDYL